MSQLLMKKYEELQDESKWRRAELFFAGMDFFQRFSSFDPVSGDADKQELSMWLRRISESEVHIGIDADGQPLDRLTRLFEHSMYALSHLMEHLRSNVTRKYEMLPLYSVRELDSNCINWLARKPGRNFRQKLSGQKTMRAVRRYMSLDTLENRLLKAYIAVVCDLLEQRKDFGHQLRAEAEPVFDKLRIWLKGEEAAQIGRWVNSVPNNVLLQDGSYSKVWRSWEWLQSLEDDTEKDIKRLDSSIFQAVCWHFLLLLFHEQGVHLIERVCFFDYDELDVTYQGKHEVRGFYRSGGNYLPFTFSYTDKLIASIEFGKNILAVRMDSEEGIFLFSDAGGHEEIIGNLTQPLRDIASVWLNKMLAAMDIEDSRWESQSAVQFDDAENLFFDLSGAYVRCLMDGRIHEMPCRSVVQRLHGEWQSVRYSRAITVSEDDSASAYSMRSLCLDEKNDDYDNSISANEQRKEKRKRRQEAAQKLVGELKVGVETNAMASVFYLVPDVPDDFCMTYLRRQFNIYFPDSQPIPRSIAGAFEWFERQETSFTLKGGEWLFILDEQGQGVTLTPIQIYIDEQWKEAFPKGHGVILERHPVKLLRSAEEVQNALEKIAPTQINAKIWREIAEVWGIESMVAEEKRMLWCIDDVTPFAETRSLEELWHQLAAHLNITEAEIKNACEEYHKGHDRCVYIDISPENFSEVKSQSTRDVMCGAEVLSCWQEMAPNGVSLWCDHLPALKMKVSLNGRAQYINLVEGGHRMQPKRGIRQKLPAIHTSMELPRGQKKITFPLFQGNLTDENARRRVSLSSNYFPLLNALDVSLEMYYTYGAEYPYELIFVGKGEGKRKIRISAEWESMEDCELEDWMIPELPEIPDVEEVIYQPMRYHRQKLSLDKFLSIWIKDLVSNVRFMNDDEESDRKYLELSQIWELDRRKKYNMRVNYQGNVVWIHENQFVKNKVGSTFDSDCDAISFDLEKSSRDFCDYNAINIMPGRNADSDVIHKWRWSVFQLRRLGMLNKWPSYVQDVLRDYLPVLEEIYFQTIDNDSKYCILRFACVLGDYMPSRLAWELVRLYQTKKHEGFFDIERWTGYAMGSLQQDWQEEILKYAYNQENFTHDEDRLNMFSIALWGHENFASQLSLDYVRQLLNLLTVTADRLINNDVKKRDLCLKNYMEAAMGLMRARVQAKNDMRFWKLLSPQKLSVLISKTEQLVNYVQQHNIKHAQSFLDIDDQRSEDMKSMDLLYYAASRIISCESQEGTLIRIKGIRFD